MEDTRAGKLGEIATEAGIERASFLTDAASQFLRFLDENADRIRDLDGLVLIDDDPDYLAITGDGTFRSRTRYQDDSGKWVSEDETIESGAELIEIYNPADIYAAFSDAARAEAGLPDQPTAAEDLLETAGIASEVGVEQAADDDDQVDVMGIPSDKEAAARMLYDLALTFQEKSQRTEASLLDDFQDASEGLAEVLGSTKIVDDEDERLWYRPDGTFEGEVIPAGDDDDEEEGASEPNWQTLTTPRDLVQFYDPTDLFGDLAEALAEEHPSVAPELEAGNEAEPPS